MIGILYDGNRIRVAGNGPDTFTAALDEDFCFKAVLHFQTVRPGEGMILRDDDWLWVLPDILDLTHEGMSALLVDLTSKIKSGGRVGLAARNKEVIVKAHKHLVLMMKEIKGRA